MPADDLAHNGAAHNGAAHDEAPNGGRPVDEGEAAEGGTTVTADPAPRQRLWWWQEILVLLGFVLVLALVIKAVFLQAFFIPSESMEPGLVINDRILVEKPSYWFGGTPQRGDIVVFEDPGGWLGEGGATGVEPSTARSVLTGIGLLPSTDHLVKRVIGVAGDTIVCCDDRGRISVNGKVLNERGYAVLDEATCFGPMTGNCDWSAGPVPDGSIFVMGDNRSHSGDSSEQLCTEAETDCVSGREFVSEDLVVGKVAGVLWPFDHLRRLGRPDVLADVPDPQ